MVGSKPSPAVRRAPKLLLQPSRELPSAGGNFLKLTRNGYNILHKPEFCCRPLLKKMLCKKKKKKKSQNQMTLRVWSFKNTLIYHDHNERKPLWKVGIRTHLVCVFTAQGSSLECSHSGTIQLVPVLLGTEPFSSPFMISAEIICTSKPSNVLRGCNGSLPVSWKALMTWHTSFPGPFSNGISLNTICP